jgi:hypothetical protein
VIFDPVAPHSVDSEFPQIEKYRGIVEEVVFDCFGWPSFFGEVVEVVQTRVGVSRNRMGLWKNGKILLNIWIQTHGPKKNSGG